MIYVERNEVPKPPSLDKKSKDGKTETDKAIEHHFPYDVTKKPFKFKAYSDRSVKNALIQLFKGKCAYCESVFLHVYSGDVEHFRPKGEIEEAAPNKKPGYYWLAADWDNLLLSCRNCNQKLTHSTYGNPVARTMGKMNQFPLQPEGKYARDHTHANGIKDEEQYRLLLNPCIDKPEEHLEYGEEGVIYPKKDANGVKSSKGEKSIDVYVLHRVPLVQSREKVQIDIQAQIQRVIENFLKFNEYIDSPDPALRFYFEKVFQRELERLKKFLNPEEPYVGMARQLIGTFLKENFEITI